MIQLRPACWSTHVLTVVMTKCQPLDHLRRLCHWSLHICECVNQQRVRTLEGQSTKGYLTRLGRGLEPTRNASRQMAQKLKPQNGEVETEF